MNRRVPCRWRLADVGAALGLLLMASGAAGAPTAPVRVTATVDRTTVTIGERLRYVVTAEGPAADDLLLVPLHGSIGDFTVEAAGVEPSRTRAGVTTRMQRYTLAIFATGEHVIPPPRALYRTADGVRHEARGPSIAITVRSLLPSDWSSQDIRGLKPLVSTVPLWWWVVGTLGILASAGGAVWWWQRRRTTAVLPASPPLPPHAVALAALELLRRAQLPSRGEYEAYYVRLSAIARRYVEDRFGLRAPEMTTEEFLQAASQARAVSTTQRPLLREFLVHCDLVKFARYRPSEAEAEAMFTAARRFVEETTPAASSPAPAAERPS